jgi:uncharacterized protein DUF559
MGRVNGRHNLDVLDEAIALYRQGSAGIKSGPELAAFSMLRFPDLPDPLANTRVLGIEVDLLWPDLKLVVEIDGGGHGRPTTQREDTLKERVLRAAGYDVLRFTDTEVEQHPERVIETLSARRPMPSSSCATLPA